MVGAAVVVVVELTLVEQVEGIVATHKLAELLKYKDPGQVYVCPTQLPLTKLHSMYWRQVVYASLPTANFPCDCTAAQ